jgi:hypothetical protein
VSAAERAQIEGRLAQRRTPVAAAGDRAREAQGAARYQEPSARIERAVAADRWYDERVLLVLFVCHYNFVVPKAVEREARALIAESDEVYARVAERFGAELGTTIDVDLSGASKWAWGQTAGTHVRMDLVSFASLNGRLATLAHETAHVFITVLSKSRLSMRPGEARFLHEGLATQVELATYGNAGARAKMRFEAAVMYGRGQAGFERLVDADTLTRELGPDALYVLGLQVVDALVAIHGRGAPVTLLRALSTTIEPWNKNGVDFWEEAFRAAGFRLDKVLERYNQTLADAYDEHKETIARLPPVAASLKKSDDAYYIVLDEPLPPDTWLACRFRSDPSEEPIAGVVRGDRTCSVHAGAISGDRIDYQIRIGDALNEMSLGFPWVQASKEGAPDFHLDAIDVMLEQICGVGGGAACFSLGQSANFDKLPARAQTFFTAGCKAGHSESCVRLGRLFEDAKGKTKETYDAFSRACELASPRGCFELGFCEDIGSCAAGHDKRAVEHYRFACDHGSADACHYLAEKYVEGEGVAVNLGQAATLFGSACERSFGPACVGLGRLYQRGAGVRRDAKEAARLFALGCHHFAMECGALAEINVARDRRRARVFFDRACNAGDADACKRLKTLAR